jgi:uncharacterized ion transporter superfamily protein YfcC
MHAVVSEEDDAETFAQTAKPEETGATWRDTIVLILLVAAVLVVLFYCLCRDTVYANPDSPVEVQAVNETDTSDRG